MSNTTTESETQAKTSTGDGDHDRFAHYADRNDVTRAYVTGEEIRALCGKVWVPSRDPKRYKVCPVCDQIMTSLHSV